VRRRPAAGDLARASLLGRRQARRMARGHEHGGVSDLGEYQASRSHLCVERSEKNQSITIQIQNASASPIKGTKTENDERHLRLPVNSYGCFRR
jgi:hypothetical protein